MAFACGPPFSSNRLLVLPPFNLTLLHFCLGTSRKRSSFSRREPLLSRNAPRTVGDMGTSSCPRRCSDIARGDLTQLIEDTDLTSGSLRRRRAFWGVLLLEKRSRRASSSSLSSLLREDSANSSGSSCFLRMTTGGGSRVRAMDPGD